MFRSTLILTLACALPLAACRPDEPAGADTDTDGPGTADDPGAESVDETGHEPDPEPDEPTQAPSARAGVKRKAPGAYARDLAASLELPPDALCLELSAFDCVDTHRIALGGVEPYALAVYEPLSEPGVTSPIAVDRIALSACGERVARDFADGTHELLAELFDSEPDVAARTAVAERLYRRLLRREGEPREVEAVVGLWDDLPDPDARTWAQLGCFAVATTLENLFY